MKVKVYKNLHKKMFSIMDYKTRKVIAHRHFVCLKNVEFKVSEAGRQRVLIEKKKNVHAFVIGDWITEEINWPGHSPKTIYYNPYRTRYFKIKENRKSIHKAHMVFLGGEILAWEKEYEDCE